MIVLRGRKVILLWAPLPLWRGFIIYERSGKTLSSTGGYSVSPFWGWRNHCLFGSDRIILDRHKTELVSWLWASQSPEIYDTVFDGWLILQSLYMVEGTCCGGDRQKNQTRRCVAEGEARMVLLLALKMKGSPHEEWGGLQKLHGAGNVSQHFQRQPQPGCQLDPIEAWNLLLFSDLQKCTVIIQCCSELQNFPHFVLAQHPTIA